MTTLGVFSVRELRQRSGELLRGAEEGRLAVVTKHGRPTILAMPFDDRLVSHGAHRALALHLFESRHLSLTQAARVAGMVPEDFVALLGEAGIAAVDYPPEEVEEEIAAAG